MNGINLGLAMVGPALLTIFIWSRIDEWWYRKGHCKWMHLILGLMKPHIQLRTKGIWAVRFFPEPIRHDVPTWYAQTRYKGWIREGTGDTPADAYRSWKNNPEHSSSGGCDWENYRTLYLCGCTIGSDNG